MLKEILQTLKLPCYLQIALNVRNNCALNDEKGGGGGTRCYFYKAHGYVSFFLNGNFCPVPSNLALLVLSIGHRKIFLKLTFRVLALCHVLH